MRRGDLRPPAPRRFTGFLGGAVVFPIRGPAMRMTGGVVLGEDRGGAVHRTTRLLFASALSSTFFKRKFTERRRTIAPRLRHCIDGVPRGMSIPAPPWRHRLVAQGRTGCHFTASW
jgi:hypothetical protein